MNFAGIASMLYAELNSAAAADLTFWSEDELLRYADLQLAKLTSGLMLFVDAQEITGVANQSTYDLAHTLDDIPLDTRFVSLIHAVWGTASLAPANMQETEARDANWTASTATVPTNWIGDWLSTGFLVAYPQPTQSATLTIFAQRTAPAMETTETEIIAPEVLGDLLHMRVLSEARGKRGDAWMPESAALAGQIADVLEQAFRNYYGAAM